MHCAAPTPQGWSKEGRQYDFRDGTSWSCEEKCTKAEGWHYEPTLFDPATGEPRCDA